ncbi:solute carrier organic anion transporter family member 4C1-like [Glandiceps talaboti]
MEDITKYETNQDRANGEAIDGNYDVTSKDVVTDSVCTDSESIGNDTKTKSTRWGWFNYRPDYLQCFNSAPWLCSSLSSLYFTQSMVMWGFLFVSLTSIEKRFDLPSTASGIIVASYDICSALVVLFISYYGNYGNKSRILSIGCFIMGCGSLIYTLPHFTSEDYLPGDENYTEQLCDRSETVADPCDDDDWTSSTLTYYFIVFIIAQCLHGLGGTPVYTVSPPYMDENVSTKRAGMYMGIMYGFSTLGPAVGLILGGYFLTIYTDIKYADSIQITPEHPAWVGAWWLGFLIGWIMSWLVSLPLSGFPEELRGTEEVKNNREVQTHHSESQIEASQQGFGVSFKDFPKSLWLLLKNPAYVLLLLSACSGAMIVTGFAVFMPKFIENQYNQTAGVASAMFGIAVIPGAVGGTVLGGWVVKRFDLKVRGMLKFIFGCTAIVLVLAVIFMMHCPEDPLAGVFVPYHPNGTDQDEANLTAACNAGCQCSTEIYSPVCGSNGVQYFDACFAGCTAHNKDEGIFYDCSCVWNSTTLSRDHYGYANEGKCDSGCEAWKLPVFLFLFFIIMIFVFARMVPGTITQMRLVPDNQRAFAMGIGSLATKLLGGVPAPIIFGVAIDKSCALWHHDCEQRGSCWVYDPLQFSFRLTLLGVVFTFLGLVLTSLTYIVYKPPTSEENGGIGKDDSEGLELSDGNFTKTPSGVKLVGYTDTQGVDNMQEQLSIESKGIAREDSQAVLVDSEVFAGDL